MDGKPAKREVHSGVAVTLLVVPVLLPIFYVLSIGPAFKAAGGSFTPTMRAFYKPLDWAAGVYPPFGRALLKYVNWWDSPRDE
jgi:hypothetical protein